MFSNATLSWASALGTLLLAQLFGGFTATAPTAQGQSHVS
jgi:hypothetical protein